MITVNMSKQPFLQMVTTQYFLDKGCQMIPNVYNNVYI